MTTPRIVIDPLREFASAPHARTVVVYCDTCQWREISFDRTRAWGYGAKHLVDAHGVQHVRKGGYNNAAANVLAMRKRAAS